MLLVALLVAPVLPAQAPATPRSYERFAVVCQSREAAAAGAAVLARGGNAVDAAVATAFAMAVTYPAAGNIGGGGFLVLFAPAREEGGAVVAETLTTFDFRERAPARAHPRMFLDEKGEYDATRHHWSHLAVGVPGTVAGLGLAHSRHGRLPWQELLAPAVKLAREGFPVSAGLAESIVEVIDDLRPAPSARRQFTREGRRPLRPGELLVQPELADTIERIANHGAREFYTGRTAELLVREMERGGGWITAADLVGYRAVERPAIVGTYRDVTVASMGPPSSGGIALVEMLNILETFDLRESGPGSAATVHLMAEAMRRAFADRARFVGDVDFVDVPIERLTSKSHAAELARSISTRRASSSSPTTFTWPPESDETTHISIVDGDGMAVSLTTTLEQSFGARIVVPGAGFLLNNQMGDFNGAPGLTTDTGLIGTPPNLAGPGKRMISSMTPTILLRDSGSGRRLAAVVGSPGGRTIINSVLGVVIQFVDFGRNIQEAVDAPRVHHQWLPDVVWLERGFSPDTRRLLRELGHDVRLRDGPQGSVMAIAPDPESGRLRIGRDRRRPGSAAAGR